MRQTVFFTLNGVIISREVPAQMMLVDVLRDELGLTGTKVSCREGECGACTVLLDDVPVNSCLLPAALVQNRRVVTIEGLRDDLLAVRVMTALAAAGASQCGYCTPGMVMSGVAMIRNHTPAEPAAIRRQLAGNLCRCTGYEKIVEAILDCMRQLEIENNASGGK